MNRPYAESFALLQERLELIGEPRPEVSRPPRHDDEEPGPSIFRYVAEDEDFMALTLPGFFVGRSSLVNVSFTGSDLRLSTFNWSDFTACDFSGCNLAGSDLRTCRFNDCSFENADLTSADLRRSAFRSCNFTGSRMAGTKIVRASWLSRLVGRGLGLTREQRAEVTWSKPGVEPEG
jgi:BTB/POZ domain-containing protein KCTD9